MIKKAIIPAAGLGTRFLPMSKAVPKELLPLVDLPMLSYAVKEARQAGVEKLCLVISERKKMIQEYFRKQTFLENVLEKQGKKELLDVLKESEKEFKDLAVSFAFQEKPLGDGDAVLQARKMADKDGCGVLFADDLFSGKTPALEELANVFKTGQKPVIGLKLISKEKLSCYGVVGVEKITSRLFKIKEIIEKPPISEAPSDLAIAGRYVINSEVFDYLKKTKPNEKGEIILAETFKTMLEDGKIIYGYEMTGDWLECGNKLDWLKSHLRLCLEHPEYGAALKEFLKKMK